MGEAEDQTKWRAIREACVQQRLMMMMMMVMIKYASIMISVYFYIHSTTTPTYVRQY